MHFKMMFLVVLWNLVYEEAELVHVEFKKPIKKG